jgi:AraC-like DNA-binding protein
LAVLLVFACYSILLYLLVSTGDLKYFPHLYKTAAPIVVFNAPLLYIYFRSILNNENKFRKYDFLHFTPALLLFINYLPFYFSDIENKQKFINYLIIHRTEDPNSKIGFVPEAIQYSFRYLQSFIYLLLQSKLLFDFNDFKLKKKYENHSKSIITWLKSLNILWATSIITMTILIIISAFGKLVEYKSLVSIINSIMSVSFCFTGLYLLVSPNVLFGMPYINILQSDEKVKKETASFLNDYNEEIRKINDYFENERPFLSTNISINEVAVALKIPVRDVSFILNQHYKQRFTDFINFYRIQFVNQEIQKGVFTEYTINSIGNNAGFSSESSFYRAFKKVNQCTPTEYIYKLKHPN